MSLIDLSNREVFREFGWYLELTCVMIASEELEKLSDMTAAEWRYRLINEALDGYQDRLTPNAIKDLKASREHWFQGSIARYKAYRDAVEQAKLHAAVEQAERDRR